MSLESYKISMHSACLHKPRWQPLHATLVNTLPCKSSQSARCQSSIDADSKSGPKQPRRSTLLSTMSFLLISQGAQAAGIEGIKPAELVEGGFGELRRKNQDFLDKGAEAFENSEILKTLRERSTANKAANKKALQDRYCSRQAELGVGDCGGLRLIPGATKSGKQKTPEWLKAVLQKLGQLPPDEAPKAAE